MKLSATTGRVNPGKAATVEVIIYDENGTKLRTVEIRADLFTAFEKKAKNLRTTTSALLGKWLDEAKSDSEAMARIQQEAGVTPERMNALMEKTGFTAADIHSLALVSVVRAMEAQIAESDEVTLPLQWMPSHPKDTAPIFIASKTARILREFCKAADVDADFWCDELIGASVNDAVRHTRVTEEGRIIFEGILGDFHSGHNFIPSDWEVIAPDLLAIVERERPPGVGLNKVFVSTEVSDETHAILEGLALAEGKTMEEYLPGVVSKAVDHAVEILREKGIISTRESQQEVAASVKGGVA